MTENKNKWLRPLLYLYLVAITVVVSYITSNMWGRELWPNERFTVVTVATIAFLLILIGLSVKVESSIKLFVGYHIIVILTVLLSLMPYEYRPIMIIFMLITLFAGLDTGMISVIGISVAMSFLYGAESEYLYGTILIGAMSCFVGHFSKDRLKLAISTIVLVFFSFFINGIFQYYNTEVFDYKFGFISLSSTVIALIVFFNVYFFVKPKSVEKFVNENSELMDEMKKKSLPLFYHSMEVGELSLAGAKALKCNERLTYGGGILHDMGKIRDGSNYVKEGLTMANEYGMPREVKAIIVENSAKHRIPTSKESAIIMLGDSVISSIEYLKAGNKDVSEKKIIDNVFQVRLNGGALEKSGFTLEEYGRLKRAFYQYYGIE